MENTITINPNTKNAILKYDSARWIGFYLFWTMQEWVSLALSSHRFLCINRGLATLQWISFGLVALHRGVTQIKFEAIGSAFNLAALTTLSLSATLIFKNIFKLLFPTSHKSPQKICDFDLQLLNRGPSDMRCRTEMYFGRAKLGLSCRAKLVWIWCWENVPGGLMICWRSLEFICAV